MSTCGKAITFVLVAVLLTLTLLVYSTTNAQITGHYGKSSDPNLVAYDITLYSPSYQGVYANTMLLDFNLTWTYDLMPLATLHGEYTYRIDNGPPVSIASNKSASDFFAGGEDFKINPKFSYSIDISNLTNGHHSITVSPSMYWQFGVLLNESAVPVLFSVENPTPSQTPTPTVPEFSWLAILPLFISLLSVALIVRHRKTAN
jgi:hypothetical protein